MSALTEKTLSVIAKEGIRPLPRWRAQWKNAAFWIGTSFLLGCSSLAATLSLHALFEIDWTAYFRAHFSWWEIVLSGVPLFSIGLLVVFLLGSLWLLQQTRYGYRYSWILLLGGFFSLSTVFGFVVEGSALDEPTERFFLYALPHAEEIGTTLLPSAKRQWSQPEQGLLGGTVLTSDAENFKLLDASQKLWTVNYSQATLESSVTVEPYEKVKIIGDQEDEAFFRAAEIREWKQKSVLSTKKQENTEDAGDGEKEQKDDSDHDEDEKEQSDDDHD